MNAANLQIEGLLMAVAAVNRCLVNKEILSREEIEQALALAEAAILGDDRALEDLTLANRDAVAFPIRLLRAANAREEAAEFAALTRSVGRNKATMTGIKPLRRGKVVMGKPERRGENDPPGGTARDHEPFGDLSDTDLTDGEAGALARDIEAERDA